MERRRMALAGIGKIATDQHVPALAASPHWKLAATVSRHGSIPGIPAYASLAAMLAAHPEVEMVSLCLPPAPRFGLAAEALAAGRHLMLEKPPGATLAEVNRLERLATSRGLSLYATWHSRMARMVAPARDILAGRRVSAARITWREDVRRWHPGQDWVFAPGGMGVFDPGINALSILTAILPGPVHLIAADLDYPANRDTPIAARLRFTGNISADLDWRQQGPQIWDVEVETDRGRIVLRQGGNRLEVDGVPAGGADDIAGEYPALYARMAELVAHGGRDVDLAPMILVADALSIGRRRLVEPFTF